MYACNGILFNHESPRRGKTFVTRKIVQAACKIREGQQDCLYLGNLDAKRDWGYAPEFCEGMWLMLQQEKPEDYVIATGQQHSVREFINSAAQCLDMQLEWQGSGVDEVAYWRNCKTRSIKEPIIQVDKRYFRPAEVETLLGDASKAKSNLGWTPRVSFNELVNEMVEADLIQAIEDARNIE